MLRPTNMSFDGPTEPIAWHEQPLDFKRVWNSDREVRHAIFLSPEKVRSIVIGNLIIGFLSLAFLGMALLVCAWKAIDDPRYWFFVVVLAPMVLVLARPVLVLAYDATLFWLGRKSRIGSALADGLERKRKKDAERTS